MTTITVTHNLPYETILAIASPRSSAHWAFLPEQEIELSLDQMDPGWFIENHCKDCKYYANRLDDFNLAEETNAYAALEKWRQRHACWGPTNKKMTCPLGIHEQLKLIHHKSLTAWQFTNEDILHYAVRGLPSASKRRVTYKPYLIANTYLLGDVCWPSGQYPTDLRQANTIFWNSGFNQDLYRPDRNIITYDPFKDYTYQGPDDEDDDNDESEEINEALSWDWLRFSGDAVFSTISNPVAIEYTLDTSKGNFLITDEYKNQTQGTCIQITFISRSGQREVAWQAQQLIHSKA